MWYVRFSSLVIIWLVINIHRIFEYIGIYSWTSKYYVFYAPGLHTWVVSCRKQKSIQRSRHPCQPSFGDEDNPHPPGILTSANGSEPTSKTFCSRAHCLRMSQNVLLKCDVHLSHISIARALVSKHPILRRCFRSSNVICSKNLHVVAPDHICESVPEVCITKTPACSAFSRAISSCDM